MLKKLILIVVGVVVLLGAGTYAAFKLSPWPQVLLIRKAFAEGAEVPKAQAARLVPPGVTEQIGLRYGEAKDALLDVFAPPNPQRPLPAVVWVHGGGYVAGTRTDLTDYLKVLASRGFVTVGIDYMRAPTGKFPTPVRQTNEALRYVVANAARFNIDPNRIFLAGDSAGAQIAAQAALVISSPAEARLLGIQPAIPRESLRGALLNCGGYDPTQLNWGGGYGDFMRTVIWSYVGTRDHTDPRVAQMSVTRRVTADYPPSFITVGNADPLAPQSTAMAEALRAKGVEVDALFYPADYKPPLGHEYQLVIGTKEGQQAFDRQLAFLQGHSG
jgi:acetyl esterase/lipase